MKSKERGILQSKNFGDWVGTLRKQSRVTSIMKLRKTLTTNQVITYKVMGIDPLQTMQDIESVIEREKWKKVGLWLIFRNIMTLLKIRANLNSSISSGMDITKVIRCFDHR